MNNLDESIGKILLEIQKDDPEAFARIMKKAQEDSPELLDDSHNANGEGMEEAQEDMAVPEETGCQE